MANIQTFSNGEFTLPIMPDGDTFTASAAELARYLAYRDATAMLRSLPDSCKGYTSLCTPGGQQLSWFVTEPGLYRALGQRQTARIKDPDIRAQVERFQSWVFDDVLPALRRGESVQTRRRGGFSSAVATPDTYTYDEVCGLLRQYYGIDLTVIELTRNLRAGGVLKQNGSPTKRYRFLFWFTETSTWNVHKHVIPQVAFKVHDTGREMQDFRFLQTRLELEGVGQDLAIR